MIKMGKNQKNSPSIMEPIDDLSSLPTHDNIICNEIDDAMDERQMIDYPPINKDFKSLSIDQQEDDDGNDLGCFQLMGNNEKLCVPSVSVFCKKMRCPENDKMKVVSIFGNTGDGKSYTMNHTFFNGLEVFKTSSEQHSCTIGVWAAYEPSINVLCLDTEGLLGVSTNNKQRERMLLKILAISDICIYRTCAERLHNDMIKFLGIASRAFQEHFSLALKSMDLPVPSEARGPAVFIFHETKRTKPLPSGIDINKEGPEGELRKRFDEMKMKHEAFSSMRYIGTQSINKQTDFSELRNSILLEIRNTTVRSYRQPSVVFHAIEALNKKFSGPIIDQQLNPFPAQYFTCGIQCESCDERCELSMGHIAEGKDHKNEKHCRYQHQYQNKEYLCIHCFNNQRKVIVKETINATNENSIFSIAKFAWSGSVILCPHCGEIYRSRKHWYGNKTPEDMGVVRTEIVHVWPGGSLSLNSQKHSAQMMVDSVTSLKETVRIWTEQPSKEITDWMTDQIAPSYWKPNNEIHHCHACKKNFERLGLSKHHCRSCGEGFCDPCSKNELPVPARGWNSPVRVCNQCKSELLKSYDCTAHTPKEEAHPEMLSSSTSSSTLNSTDEPNIRARKYGEVAINTLSAFASVLEYPKDFIKDMARPTYWVPDAESPDCIICKEPFGTAEDLMTTKTTRSSFKQNSSKDSLAQTLGDRKRHHCRACGQAVCDNCSLGKRPVPERGWPGDVRVCNNCFKI